MSIVKRIIASLMTITMLISLTACGESTSSAANIDGYDIRAGIYIYYTITAYSEAYTKLTEGNTELTGDFFSQKVDNKDTETWIVDKAKQYMKEFVAVERKFDELELELDQSTKNKIKVRLDNEWSYSGEIYEKNGISKKSVEDVVTNSYKKNLIFKKYYDTKGIDEVSEQDLKVYFKDNYARIKYVAIALKDGEGNLLKTEGKAEMMKMAEAYVERLKAGEDIEVIREEYTEWYEKLVEEAKGTTDDDSSKDDSSDTDSSSEDDSSSTDSSKDDSSSTDSSKDDSSSSTDSDTEEEEDPYANEYIINKEQTSPSEKFVKKLFESVKIGTPAIIEDDEIYYVVVRTDLFEREGLYDDYRDSLLQSLKGDEFDEQVTAWADELKVELNDKAMKRYDVKDLKFE